MTNRNRKRAQLDEKKHKQAAVKGAAKTTGNELCSKGRGSKTVLSIISVVISAIALAIAIISICFQVDYADKEYRYKLPPEIEIRGAMEAQTIREGNERKIHGHISDITIRILHKNNLEAAYMITADDEVKELEIDEIENTLKEDMGNEIEMGNPNIIIGETAYYYNFLLLKGLDDSYELSLIYSKSMENRVRFGKASGIEIYGLKNSHPKDEKYTGERQMAQQYEKILAGCEKYIFQ